MDVLAQLDGEVIGLAVDPARGRAFACTNKAGAAVFAATDGRVSADEEALAFIRGSLRGLLPEDDEGRRLEVRAAFVGGLLYLNVAAFHLRGGGSGAALAFDLTARTTHKPWRDTGDDYLSMYPPEPSALGERLALLPVFNDGAPEVLAFAPGASEGRRVLRLGPEVDGVPVAEGDEEPKDDEDDVVQPSIRHLFAAPDGRHLYLVTEDPDNGDGNRIRALALDAEGDPAVGAPETLVLEMWAPYSPVIGGACVNPHTGEVACLMFASEWERFVPITRMPEEGDWLPAADLHLAKPGAPPRKVDVCGRLGVNIAFYDREADAPNLPHGYRIQWNFGGAGHEVTPVLALGPDTYLVGLWRGTLLTLNAGTGEHAAVHEFGEDVGITALAPGLTPGTALVGLSDGRVCAVPVPV